MKNVDVLAALLLVIGGLNWGLPGFAGSELAVSIRGEGAWTSAIVYGLTGLSAVYQALQWKVIQRRWLAKSTA